MLRCVRLKLPVGVSAAQLVVRTGRPPAIQVPAGSSTPLELRCDRGFVPTGYGLDRGARPDVTIAAAVPGARGWRFRVENSGAGSARARLSIRCLKRVVNTRHAGEPTTLGFGFTRPAFSNTVFQNSPGFSHGCKPSESSVATGSEVDPAGRIELRGSYPIGPRYGRWNFARGGSGQEARTFLVCLSRRTQFR